MKTAIKFICYW